MYDLYLPTIVNFLIALTVSGVGIIVLRYLNRKRSKLMKVLALCVLLVFLAVSVRSLVNEATILYKKEVFAKELGIDLNTFPWVKSFPANFLNDRIKNGDSRLAVHEAFKGYYERAVTCDTRSEIYFFLSTSEDDAQMLKVSYDENSNVAQIWQSDNNSFRFSVGGCKEGIQE